jgi:hypothetical protein
VWNDIRLSDHYPVSITFSIADSVADSVADANHV